LNNSLFEVFIMFLIIGNIIVMAIEYDDMPKDFEGILNNFSEFFTV